MRILGIDYGSKRVGIAVSDEGKQFGMPHTVLKNDTTLLQEIERICSEQEIEKIILGESHDLMGKPNSIQKDIAVFAEEVKKNLKIPLEFEPEFFTSAQAVRDQGQNEKLDASAAALILQSYLDKHHG